MAPPIKYRRKADVVARSVAGENLLVPVHACTHSVYTLNAAACRLWDAIETPRTEDELVALLVQRYRIAEAAARTDVRSFLEDLTVMELAERLE